MTPIGKLIWSEGIWLSKEIGKYLVWWHGFISLSLLHCIIQQEAICCTKCNCTHHDAVQYAFVAMWTQEVDWTVNSASQITAPEGGGRSLHSAASGVFCTGHWDLSWVCWQGITSLLIAQPSEISAQGEQDIKFLFLFFNLTNFYWSFSKTKSPCINQYGFSPFVWSNVIPGIPPVCPTVSWAKS